MLPQNKLTVMRLLAEYRNMHARAQGLVLFRLVLDEVVKKDVAPPHKVSSLYWLPSVVRCCSLTPRVCFGHVPRQTLLRILKRIMEKGIVLTATNFFSVLHQMHQEQPGDEWPRVCHDALHVLAVNLGVSIVEYVGSGRRKPAWCRSHREGFAAPGTQRGSSPAGSRLPTCRCATSGMWGRVSTAPDSRSLAVAPSRVVPHRLLGPVGTLRHAKG